MNSAVIVAAGSGKRMGLSMNKVFMDINGQPVLYYTLKAFEDNKNIDEIILVLKDEEKEYFLEKFRKYGFKKIKALASGGKERKDSVGNGLKFVSESSEVVLIHDGARCFITEDIIDKGVEFAKVHGAATPAVRVKDTVKIIGEDGFVKEDLKRESLRAVQTPQCFRTKELKEAYENALSKEMDLTDDNEVYSLFFSKKSKDNGLIYIYEGSEENIKVTSPLDKIVGEIILSKR